MKQRWKERRGCLACAFPPPLRPSFSWAVRNVIRETQELRTFRAIVRPAVPCPARAQSALHPGPSRPRGRGLVGLPERVDRAAARAVPALDGAAGTLARRERGGATGGAEP